MIYLISLGNVLLPLLYLLALILYGLYFFRNDKSLEPYLSPLLRITVLIHFAEVVFRGIYFSHFPMAGIFEAATVMALAIAVIYLYIETRIKEKSTGYFILLLVFSLQLISSAFIDFVDDIPEILNNPLFIFHTSAAILGYTGLAISALYSVMYLLLFKEIKKKRFGLIYSRMPSLAVLEEMMMKAAWLGIGFLTLAILLGIYWSFEIFGTFVYSDSKIIIALITWVFYMVGMLVKKYRSISGKKVAMISLSGFSLIVVSLLAVNLFFQSFHKFY